MPSCIAINNFIDFFKFHFKLYKIKNYELPIFLVIGNSYDSSLSEILLQNKSTVNIFTTYNSPYSIRYFFLFENGIIEQIDNNLMINGPAMNLDKKGFFKKPNVIKSFNVSENNDYIVSLEKSINFLKKCYFSGKVR